MPLYDQECTECGHVFEVIAGYEDEILPCEVCNAPSKRIISCTGIYTTNEDAAWLKSAAEVVDKDSDAPHCVEFRKNPTRSNYHRWMKGEGLRPLEPGERLIRPGDRQPDMERINKEVWDKHRDRMRINI